MNITFWERTTGGKFPPFQHTVKVDVADWHAKKIQKGEGVELNMAGGEVYQVQYDGSVANNGWWAKDNGGRLCRVTLEI